MSKENYLEHWRGLSGDEVRGLIRGKRQYHPSRFIAQDLINIVGGRVLECGIGSGVDLEQMVVRGITRNIIYTGLDPSPEIIKMMSHRFPAFNFREGTVEKLPFADKIFDVVYVRHVLEHLPGHQPALNELIRITKRLLIICLFIEMNNEAEQVWWGEPDTGGEGGVWYHSYFRPDILPVLSRHFAYVQEQPVAVPPELQPECEANWLITAAADNYVYPYYNACLFNTKTDSNPTDLVLCDQKFEDHRDLLVLSRMNGQKLRGRVSFPSGIEVPNPPAGRQWVILGGKLYSTLK